MTGGLMQIIAFGTQDMFLIGKPQITHWKVVYRRHTNFATESFEQVFNGTGDFGKKVVCQIQRNGDLISKMYLRVVLPALGGMISICDGGPFVGIDTDATVPDVLLSRSKPALSPYASAARGESRIGRLPPVGMSNGSFHRARPIITSK